MCHGTRLTMALFAIGLSTAATGSTARAADDLPKAVLIFDGSGSMRGQIGNKSKYAIARRTLSAILPSYDDQIALGLIAYGHRRKSDCNDIEILAAPELRQTSDIVDSIKALRPRGKTPIASSLESATTLLAGQEHGHIIVLTDGVENCRKDLCETVDAVREATPGITISTIGLGLRKKDAARVRCIAERGGGRMVVAPNAAALRTGLLDILDDVASGATLVAAEQSNKIDDTKQPAAPETLGPPTLQLRALQTKSGPLIEDGVQWNVTRLDDGSSATIYSGTKRNPDIPVTKGRYRIEARIGSGTASREISVTADGKRSVHLPMNLARLDLQLATPLRRGETIALVQTKSDASETIAPKLIARQDFVTERFYLPPGSYTLRRDGSAISERQDVSLQVGETNALTFDTRLGTLKPIATLALGSPQPARLIYIVEQKTAQGSTGWREVTRSAAARPAFTLPAGQYRLTARADQAEASEMVTIKARQTTPITLNLGAGTLQLAAINLAGTELPKPLRFRIQRKGTGNSNAITTSRSDPQLTVAAGTYRVDAIAGHANVKASTEVVVNAGTTERAEVSFNPALLKLTLTDAQGAPPPRHMMWTIATQPATGIPETVWSGTSTSPNISLAPGNYQVTASIGSREASRTIIVTGGSVRTLELPRP